MQMSELSTITFAAGVKLVMERARQGLKPLIRIEAKSWKRKYHSVVIKARLEPDDEWQEVIASKVPIASESWQRSWDATALKLWDLATLGIQAPYGRAYLTQHLSNLMFTYEVEVTEVARKGELGL
jgi:hypothetical protein